MICDEAYWVDEDKILGMRKPTSLDEIEELRVINITGIISLLDNTENHDLYRSAVIDYRWIPVKGGSIPSKEQVLDAYSFATEKWSRGEAVAVHCTGGKKRTGTLIVALLIFLGDTSEVAMEKLQKANPEIKLSDMQMSFLEELIRPSSKD